MVSRGTQDLLINLGIVVLVIVVIYVVIIRNPKALDWLKGLGTSKTGAVTVGAVHVNDQNIEPFVRDFNYEYLHNNGIDAIYTINNNNMAEYASICFSRSERRCLWFKPFPERRW